MTNTFTITGANVDTNESSGRKVLHGTLSFTNPYTASGEVIGAMSTYFKSLFFGGNVTYIDGAVSLVNCVGPVLSKFRGNSSSYAAPILQFFNVSLGGSTAGTLVDHTTANISNITVGIQAWGI